MRVVEIVFSPSGGTARAARMVSCRWSDAPLCIDLSDAGTDFSECRIEADDFVLVAMPSFSGRAPAVAMERFCRIAGNGARCVLLCVYGNRAYEDTLAEMADGAAACGFRVLAALSAVAEHSIAGEYASGRPDARDALQLAEFADRILEAANHSAPPVNLQKIPGNRPYKPAGRGGMVPQPAENCVKCGLCVRQCPVNAIDSEVLHADPKRCISCMRCRNSCPKKARKIDAEKEAAVRDKLRPLCSDRKANELFL